ncbi:MAG: hypothetical protein AB4040_06245 [Synechococcus sp.]
MIAVSLRYSLRNVKIAVDEREVRNLLCQAIALVEIGTLETDDLGTPTFTISIPMARSLAIDLITIFHRIKLDLRESGPKEPSPSSKAPDTNHRENHMHAMPVQEIGEYKIGEYKIDNRESGNKESVPAKSDSEGISDRLL